MPAPSPSPPTESDTLGAAAACVKRGDFEAALTHLKALLVGNPRHELANGMLAGLYAQLKMPDRARHFFEQVLRLNPTNVLARFQLGLLHLDSGQPREALEAWQSKSPGPEDYLTHYYSAVALLELSRPEEANAQLLQAAQHMPVDHPLHPELQRLRHSLQS